MLFLVFSSVMDSVKFCESQNSLSLRIYAVSMMQMSACPDICLSEISTAGGAPQLANIAFILQLSVAQAIVIFSHR